MSHNMGLAMPRDTLTLFWPKSTVWALSQASAKQKWAQASIKRKEKTKLGPIACTTRETFDNGKPWFNGTRLYTGKLRISFFMGKKLATCKHRI